MYSVHNVILSTKYIGPSLHNYLLLPDRVYSDKKVLNHRLCLHLPVKPNIFMNGFRPIYDPDWWYLTIYNRDLSNKPFISKITAQTLINIITVKPLNTGHHPSPKCCHRAIRRCSLFREGQSFEIHK